MSKKPAAPDLAGFFVEGQIRNGQSWLVARNVPGWESFEISLRATMTGAEPIVTALHIDALDDADNLDLTGFKLRTLPIKAIALAGLRWDTNVYRDALSSLADEGGEHDSRAATTVQDFAEQWLEGNELGHPPQAYALKALHLSQSTAERYTRRARKLGLIPETKRSLAQGQSTDNREE